MMDLLPIPVGLYDVDIALAYATPKNLTGRPIYRPEAGCYLNPEAAERLRQAISLARPLGLRLLIFDAFRPSEAQWVLWNHTPDPDFLADPRRGSPHSRGAAVDLTLVDGATGIPLDMGTPFDFFDPRSHHGNQEISVEAQRNRFLLMGLMTSAGWDFYRNEWWHYQLFSARDRFPVLNDSALGAHHMMPKGTPPAPPVSA